MSNWRDPSGSDKGTTDGRRDIARIRQSLATPASRSTMHVGWLKALILVGFAGSFVAVFYFIYNSSRNEIATLRRSANELREELSQANDRFEKTNESKRQLIRELEGLNAEKIALSKRPVLTPQQFEILSGWLEQIPSNAVSDDFRRQKEELLKVLRPISKTQK